MIPESTRVYLALGVTEGQTALFMIFQGDVFMLYKCTRTRVIFPDCLEPVSVTTGLLKVARMTHA